jgi:hypothetical protein
MIVLYIFLIAISIWFVTELGIYVVDLIQELLDENW